MFEIRLIRRISFLVQLGYGLALIDIINEESISLLFYFPFGLVLLFRKLIFSLISCSSNLFGLVFF